VGEGCPKKPGLPTCHNVATSDWKSRARPVRLAEGPDGEGCWFVDGVRLPGLLVNGPEHALLVVDPLNEARPLR
jgi:hypothetical protein